MKERTPQNRYAVRSFSDLFHLSGPLRRHFAVTDTGPSRRHLDTMSGRIRGTEKAIIGPPVPETESK
jgi:hypothetical protein